MPQLAAIKASLEIPAFNPNKNKIEKDRERRERLEREELERKEAESRRESREVKERERRERDERDRDRDRERREREREEREWESRRPSKDTENTNKQPDVEGRLLADYEPPPIEQGLLTDPQQRGVGPTSLQKFNEQENETGEVGHLPNCEISVTRCSKFSL